MSLGFFAVALLYATIGFGGGSSYIALLALVNTPYVLIPKIGLICNLLVVTGGCWFYFKKGHFQRRLIMWFVIPSVPMAFLGGLYPIQEKTFLTSLALSLIAASLRLLFLKNNSVDQVHAPNFPVAVAAGAGLGFLSGLVGIGGGIFLSPLLLMCKWSKPKEAAATASLFIFLNSIAGLCGQILKSPQSLVDVTNYFYLFIAVVVGGQVGSRIGTSARVPEFWVRRATGVLILVIGGQLLVKTVIKLVPPL